MTTSATPGVFAARPQGLEHQRRQGRRVGGGQEHLGVGHEQHARHRRGRVVHGLAHPGGGRAGLDRGGARPVEAHHARVGLGGHGAHERRLAHALRPADQHAEARGGAQPFEQLGAAEDEVEPLAETARGVGLPDEVGDGDHGLGGGRSRAPRTPAGARRGPGRGRRACVGPRRRAPGPCPCSPRCATARPSSGPTQSAADGSAPAGGSAAVTVTSSVVHVPPRAAASPRRAPAASEPGIGARSWGSSESVSPGSRTFPVSARRSVSGARATVARREPASSMPRATATGAAVTPTVAPSTAPALTIVVSSSTAAPGAAGAGAGATRAAVVRAPVTRTASQASTPRAVMTSGCRRTTPRRASPADVPRRARRSTPFGAVTAGRPGAGRSAGPVVAGPVVAGPVVAVPSQAEPAGAPGATAARDAGLGGWRRRQRAGALRAAGAVALVVPLVVELAGVVAVAVAVTVPVAADVAGGGPGPRGGPRDPSTQRAPGRRQPEPAVGAAHRATLARGHVPDLGVAAQPAVAVGRVGDVQQVGADGDGVDDEREGHQRGGGERDGHEQRGDEPRRHPHALQRRRRHPADHQRADHHRPHRHHDRLRPEARAELDVERQRGQRDERAGGRGDADEELARVRRGLLVVGERVEPGETQRRRDDHGERDHPADADVVERPEEQDQRGRHPERDAVRERVELGAHAAGGVEETGQAPVEGVEHRGEGDRGEGGGAVVREHELHAGQPGAQREDGDRVRQQAHPAAAAALGDVGRHRGSVPASGRSASTVSPPTARWPGSTRTVLPGGSSRSTREPNRMSP